MLSEAAKKDPAMSGQTDYERREGDFYATPPENVDCLLHYVDMTDEKVWEPAAGEGHISKRLSEFCKVTSTDLYDRGYCQGGVDFLKQDKISDITEIDTNPPFGDMAEKFIRHALELTKPVEGMVAMFLRNEYDMADKRIDLFENHPAYSRKICVTKRPRWIEGSKGSPRHNYAWYVWDWTHIDDYPTINYIHPRNARPEKQEERIYEWNL